MAKPTRCIAIIASLCIACAVHAATTTKPAIRRSHARTTHASYRAVRYARQASSQSSKTSHASTTKSHARTRRRYSRRRTYRHKLRLPSGPTPERITEIQTALSHGGYYKGDPSGKWDTDTVAAVQKFQSANNIDATGKLDAPTLQKLGLGSDIAGVAAPRTVVPKNCCSAPGSPSAPATPAQPAGAAVSGSTPSAAAGASSAASIAPPAASSNTGASDPASSSKPAGQH